MAECAHRDPTLRATEAGRQSRHGLRRILALTLLLGTPVAAQSPGTAPVVIPGVHTAPRVPQDEEGPLDSKMEAKRIEQLNTMRQKTMLSDVDRLLRLTQQLNDDAAAGGTKMSTAARLHTASEIEKLAKDVKEKMTFAIGAPPDQSTPFLIWQR